MQETMQAIMRKREVIEPR